MRRWDAEALWRDHSEGLFGFLAYRLGDRTAAEDVLSTTFERALRARRRPRAGEEKPWLYAIALNLVRDDARRRSAEERALARTPEVHAPDEADRIAARDLVDRGLAGLAEEEREAVALRFGAELTVPEMAALLELPLSTVEGRVYRALRKLRAELGAEAQIPGGG